MFTIHLDTHELKEKLTERNEKQRRKFSKQLEAEIGSRNWKLDLRNFRMFLSDLTLKRFFYNLMPSPEHSQCTEDSALCTRWGWY